MTSTREIIKEIATGEEGEYRVTWKEFTEVEELLSNKRAK